MTLKNKINTYLSLGLFSLLIISCNDTPKGKNLPIMGPKSAVITPVDEFKVGDTIYHTIPYFHFMNQDSTEVTSTDYQGFIYVADFFFVTCPSICPIMTDNLTQVQKATSELAHFKLISHTVNPEGDSISVLKEYAEKKGADLSNWDFVRGDRNYTYDIAARGYFQNADVDSLAPGGFLHSAQFTLIDTKGRIRGVYDGIDPAAIQQLITDIRILDSLEFKINNHE